MSDARSETSAENGRKGGRPLSASTINRQLAREYISQQVKDSLATIVTVAISQAIKGEAEARKWLSEYAWGKPAINLGVDEEGQPVTSVVFDGVFEPNAGSSSKKKTK